jgi:hypothetical protein
MDQWELKKAKKRLEYLNLYLRENAQALAYHESQMKIYINNVNEIKSEILALKKAIGETNGG